MKSKAKVLAFTVLLVIMTLGVTTLSARPVVVRGRTFVYVPFRPYYYYDPFWYGSAGPPVYASPRYAHGAIKTEIEPKYAQVYINGGYAGTADKFRGAFHGLDLRPGNYNLEFRAPNYEPLRIQVYV